MASHTASTSDVAQTAAAAAATFPCQASRKELELEDFLEALETGFDWMWADASLLPFPVMSELAKRNPFRWEKVMPLDLLEKFNSSTERRPVRLRIAGGQKEWEREFDSQQQLRHGCKIVMRHAKQSKTEAEARFKASQSLSQCLVYLPFLRFDCRCAFHGIDDKRLLRPVDASGKLSTRLTLQAAVPLHKLCSTFIAQPAPRGSGSKIVPFVYFRWLLLSGVAWLLRHPP